MTVHFLTELKWQCVDTGILSLLDPLSLMQIVGQITVSCLFHVSADSMEIGTNMCRVLGNLYISSPLHVSLLCRLQVPWIEDETLHICPESRCPMPELCLSTRELMWLHADACRFAL